MRHRLALGQAALAFSAALSQSPTLSEVPSTARPIVVPIRGGIPPQKPYELPLADKERIRLAEEKRQRKAQRRNRGAA
jgi:hypothetical protein